MMKNVDKYAIAVRKPDKEIELKIENYTPVSSKCKLFKLPIIRGVFNFVESLLIGVKTLTYSAEFYDEEEDDKTKGKDIEKNEEEIIDNNSEEVAKKKETSDDLFMVGTVIFSIVLAVGLFMLLPAFLASLLDGVVKNHFALGLIEGVIRLAIFLLYVVLITLMEDIKRTFMYHGAEHKTINCLEAGEDLTVENIMKHSRFHKRCGTSFLFIVMFVSILVFMCIRTETVWLKLLYRVLLVPVIAGISYEFIKFAGKYDNAVANILSKPGLWVQRLTTKEPTEDMVEVAIKAVEGVLDWREYLEEQKNEKK
ncbi:MAG: DUF1385 domain-containing protein [Lachnospiraceae bacterium]|nr:DUF1385 domain-containing protein [Lachnospiraceae bacterium]